MTSEQEKIPNEVFSSPRLKSQIGIYLPLKGVSYSNESRIKNTFLFPTIPLSLIQYTAGRHLLILSLIHISVSGTEEAAPQSSSTEGDSIADTVQALVALGYSNGEAYRAVHSVPEAEKLDAEQLLKEALKKVLTFL